MLAAYRSGTWLDQLIAGGSVFGAAMPLFLLKIEAAPSEAAWLAGLVFISFIFPARLLTGLALACARNRPKAKARCAAFCL